MKPLVHDVSARPRSGEPSPGLDANDRRNDRPRNRDLAELDGEIAGLVDRSTEELRRAWRTIHHTGPPLGLSRDLIIRGLADELQQRAHGSPSRALQRRVRVLAAEFEKGARSFDPGIVPKTGATLMRQWRGHTHTVLVREDGFMMGTVRITSINRGLIQNWLVAKGVPSATVKAMRLSSLSKCYNRPRLRPSLIGREMRR
jgi:hypothetical protein